MQPDAGQLYQIAERQAGYLTTRQAERVGYSRPLLHHHTREGRLVRAGWGIYRLRDFPASDDEELVCLMLWSRTRDGQFRAVASYETALARFELSDAMPARTNLSVPKNFKKAPPTGVVLHRSDLQQGDWLEQGILRITTVERTILDLIASNRPLDLVVQALADARDKGFLRRKQLDAWKDSAKLARAGDTLTRPPQAVLQKRFDTVLQELR